MNVALGAVEILKVSVVVAGVVAATLVAVFAIVDADVVKHSHDSALKKKKATFIVNRFVAVYAVYSPLVYSEKGK